MYYAATGRVLAAVVFIASGLATLAAIRSLLPIASHRGVFRMGRAVFSPTPRR